MFLARVLNFNSIPDLLRSLIGSKANAQIASIRGFRMTKLG